MCGMCTSLRWCVRVCMGVRGGAWVCGCVRGYAWVYTCVWDELSEFLPENRVPTSADFNTYPIRIFIFSIDVNEKENDDLHLT